MKREMIKSIVLCPTSSRQAHSKSHRRRHGHAVFGEISKVFAEFLPAGGTSSLGRTCSRMGALMRLLLDANLKSA